MSPGHPDDAGFSDPELVRRAKSGDGQACRELVDRYAQKAYGVARGILRHAQDAEDVVQQAFLNAFASLQQFRGDASFSTWFMTILRNAAFRVVDERRQCQSVTFEVGNDGAGNDDHVPSPNLMLEWSRTPEKLLEDADTGRVLADGVGKLSDALRVVFVFRDVEGMTVKETAEALGVSEQTVKTRLHRARLGLAGFVSGAFNNRASGAAPLHRHGEGAGMECMEMLGLLGEYVDESVAPDIRTKVERHIAGCDPCRVVLDNLRKTVTLYKAGALYSLPPKLGQQLYETLQRHLKADSTERAANL